MIQKIKQLIFDILFRQNIRISSDESLGDKVILITGAGKGIGKAIAKVLYKQGARLTLMSRNQKELKKASALYDKDRTLLLKGDVSLERDCFNVASRTIHKFGKIDVLINNAGIFAASSMEDIKSDWLDKAFSANVKGMFLMAKAVIPYMKKQKYGLIINIGSKISHNSKISPGRIVYASTKYAVEGFSYALSQELRPFGIKVTCLMPATVNTFRSMSAKNYLSPFTVAQVISMIIKIDEANFESIIFRSVRQDI